MKFSTNALSLAIFLSGAAVGEVSSSSSASIHQNGGGLPPNHPPTMTTMHPTLAKFSSQFRCPYAQEWLTKGAHKAAIDLGLTTKQHNDNVGGHEQHRRRRILQQSDDDAVVVGSCKFTNPWSGESCMEFRGKGWTEDSMKERCDAEADSVLTSGEEEGCPKPSDQAGYCLKSVDGVDGAIEATSMMITPMSDCGGNKMACETFVGGTFSYASGCAATSGEGEDSSSSSSSSSDKDYGNMKPPNDMDGDTSCIIAPGAIGAAHQAGFSSGYSSTCPGTPAEGSPYMWPLKWSADVDSQSMQFGSDDVIMRSKNRVFYRLDKNWKRSDTTYSKGVRRTIGQGPCPPDQIDEEFSKDGLMSCKMDDDINQGSPLSTMIHKGSKMYFITWKNDTNVKVGETDPSLIEECNYMDLMVIGNIRPDWFLDNRGDDTDVQYLGDQHAYYANMNRPKLLKQWRKKDFANQYFVMSMQGNPNNSSSSKAVSAIEDTLHWPLILNVPGEGFGDDFLQVYENHTLLSDDDDDLFELVDNLLKMNGTCPLIASSGGEDGGSIGPPTTEIHIPSNLEVDPNSWFTKVYTFSPVWQPPMNIATDDSSSSSGMAVTEKDRVRVESCYDEGSKSVHMNVEFQDIEPIVMGATSELPWMSLGYRSSDVCSMTPMDGSDSDIIMITSQSPSSSSTAPKAYYGKLSAAAKSLSPAALTSINDSLLPLEDTAGYSDVNLVTPLTEETTTTVAAIERSTSITGSDDTNNNRVVLAFKQEFNDGPPEVMNLMYAIGMSAQLGIHVSRSCFDITDFPTCPSSSSSSSSSSNSDKHGGDDGSEIEPNTNESIEEWKEENAASSSSSSSSFSSSSILLAASSSMAAFVVAFLMGTSV